MSRMRETIASLAEPVGNMPARCCFVTVRRRAHSKDVEIAASLNCPNPPFTVIELASLNVSVASGFRHRQRSRSKRFRAELDGDDDLRSGVALPEISDRLGNVAQRKR